MLRKTPLLQQLLWFILLSAINSAQAELISLQSAEGIEVSAEYKAGEKARPLIIFIHGFLQTREFPTVKRLSDSLYETGFSVLSPNLSLGISNRLKSLSCEALHLHSLNAEVDEISHWVKWAKSKEYKEIILLGHSAGAVAVTAYLSRRVDPVVKKTVLINVTYYGPGRPASYESVIHARRANKAVKMGNKGIENYALAFCEKYPTTAENFLSYYNWSKRQVLQAINTTTVETHIILGDSDQRLGVQWVNDLMASDGRAIIISGANHFFDREHEFDLLDAVENILSTE